MIRNRWHLVLAAIFVASTAGVVLAGGKISNTAYGAPKAGQALGFGVVGECPDQGANEPISLMITITDQNMVTVAQASATGTGTTLNLNVAIPKGFVQSGDTFTATVVLDQHILPGDTTDASVSVA